MQDTQNQELFPTTEAEILPQRLEAMQRRRSDRNKRLTSLQRLQEGSSTYGWMALPAEYGERETYY